MRSPSALLLGTEARQAVWDRELAHRRVAVARWRGTDKAPGEVEGGRGGWGWGQQCRKIGAGRPLADAAE